MIELYVRPPKIFLIWVCVQICLWMLDALAALTISVELAILMLYEKENKDFPYLQVHSVVMFSCIEAFSYVLLKPHEIPLNLSLRHYFE